MNKSNYEAPTYFENFVTYENESLFKDLNEIEWRGQIKSSTNNKKFGIKYYGDLFGKENLIVGTDFSEALVIAEDIVTKEQIVIFDGCKFGYNAMLCDEYSKEEINNRPTEKMYTDKNGNKTFEIVVSTYNGIPYDEEMEDFINEENKVELISGEIISPEQLERNGFDWFAISIINEKGKLTRIVDEELA